MFCNDCWKDHIDHVLLNNVVSFKSLICPGKGCISRISKNVIEEVASARALKIYNNLLIKEFVNDHSTVLRWCPGKGCECIVERMQRTTIKPSNFNNSNNYGNSNNSTSTNSTTSFPQGITKIINFNSMYCNDNLHFFCFECGSLPHDPVSCEMFDHWLDLVQKSTGVDPRTGESNANAMNQLSEQWVQRNTKRCPKCELAIMKHDGCNHMTCRNPKCNHQWCWICEKDWKDCGGTYNCKIVKSGEIKNNDVVNKKISKVLKNSQETIEYFGHFLSKEHSTNMERTLFSGDIINRRVNALLQYTMNTKNSLDPLFIVDAVVCLLKNRYFLRGLTAFHHYMFKMNDGGEEEEEEEGQEQKKNATSSTLSLRGALGKMMYMPSSSSSIKLFQNMKKTFDLFLHELSSVTELLSDVAGRRTFCVPYEVVIHTTNIANHSRRKMKDFLRCHPMLSQRTIHLNDQLFHPMANSKKRVNDESKVETTNRIEEKTSDDDDLNYLNDNDRYIEIPVRGLHASLRQLSNGETSILTSKNLRTSSTTSEDGRELLNMAIGTSPTTTTIAIKIKTTSSNTTTNNNITGEQKENAVKENYWDTIHELVTEIPIENNTTLTIKSATTIPFQKILKCGKCQNSLTMQSVPHHSCDLCRTSISNNAHRCNNCDYVVCEACWNLHESRRDEYFNNPLIKEKAFTNTASSPSTTTNNNDGTLVDEKDVNNDDEWNELPRPSIGDICTIVDKSRQNLDKTSLYQMITTSDKNNECKLIKQSGPRKMEEVIVTYDRVIPVDENFIKSVRNEFLNKMKSSTKK